MVFVDCAYVLQDFTSFEGSYDHEYCFNGYYAFKANLNIKNKGLSDFPGGETFEINSFANYISSYSIRINNELSDKSTTNELLKDRLFNKIKLTIEKLIKSEESIEVALDFYINQNYFNKTSYGNFTIFINNTLPLDYINNESINFTFNHPNVALRQEDFIIKHIEKHIIYERDNNYNIIISIIIAVFIIFVIYKVWKKYKIDKDHPVPAGYNIEVTSKVDSVYTNPNELQI